MKSRKPVSFGVGGNSGGAAVSSADSSSSIAVTSTPSGDTNIKLTTDDKVALVVDQHQNLIVGTETVANPSAKLTIVAPDGQCLQLVNQTTQASVSFITSPNGNLVIDATGSSIQLGTNKIYIGSNSLYLGSAQVVSSAAELNYVSTSPGTAQSVKALVVDATRNIANLNAVTASTLTGTILTEDQPNITSLSDVNMTSLSLNGSPVLASADEINLIRGVTPGITRAERVVIVDTNRSIRDVNSLTANTLIGELATAAQPNITSVGALTSLQVLGAVGIGKLSMPQATLDIVETSPTLRLANDNAAALFSINSGGNLQINADNDIVIGSTTTVRFAGSSEITGLASVNASTLTGTIQTSYQPHITSIGELITLSVQGDIAIGTGSSNTSSNRMVISEPSGQCLQLVRSAELACRISISPQGDLELNPTQNLRLAGGKSFRMNGAITGVTDILANTLSGELQTAVQPKITSIGTLGSLNVTSAIVAGSLSASTLDGTLLTSEQPNISKIGTLTDLTVSNRILTTTVSASTLSGELQTAAQSKITSVGTLTLLNVSGAIAASSLNAATLTGTLQTAAQPNIQSVGTLNSLTVGGFITAISVSADTLSGELSSGPQPNVTAVGTLQSIHVVKSVNTDAVLASTITGQLQTGAQPNITSVGTLGSLAVSGAATVASLVATALEGTLTTGLQPNITSVGTLNRVLTSGPVGIGVTTPSCALDIDTSGLTSSAGIRITDGRNITQLQVGSSGCTIDTGGSTLTLGSNTNLRFVGGTIVDLASLSANTLTGQLTLGPQPNVTSVGSLTFLDTIGCVGIGGTHSDDFRLNVMNPTGKLIRLSNDQDHFYVQMINGDYTISTTNDRIAFGSNVDLVLNQGTILGLSNLSATSLTGELTTAAQPKVTSVGVLNSLSCSGAITGTTATFRDIHLSGDLTIDGALKLPSNSTGRFEANIDATSATNGGTLTVSGGGAFSKSLYVGTDIHLAGNVYLGESVITSQTVLALTEGTPGVVSSGFLRTNTNGDLAGFHLLSTATIAATNIEGTIQTNAQPKITAVGNLDTLNVVGYVGIGTSTPTKQLEINSTTGNCLRLICNKATNARAFLDVSVDASGNGSIVSNGGITTLNGRLVSTQITLGETTNSQLPLEIGFNTFAMTQPFAFNTAANSHGICSTVGTVFNYSIRALGRILCTTSIDVMSDRRKKKNIQELSDEYCTAFVKNTTPVSFNWKEGDQNKAYGYIAQDLIRAGYSDLVNLAEDDSTREEIDEDGFISPQGVKFTVTYEHIIPILAKNQRLLMQENAELKVKLDKILDELASTTARLVTNQNA